MARFSPIFGLCGLMASMACSNLGVSGLIGVNGAPAPLFRKRDDKVKIFLQIWSVWPYRRQRRTFPLSELFEEISQTFFLTLRTNYSPKFRSVWPHRHLLAHPN